MSNARPGACFWVGPRHLHPLVLCAGTGAGCQDGPDCTLTKNVVAILIHLLCPGGNVGKPLTSLAPQRRARLLAARAVPSLPPALGGRSALSSILFYTRGTGGTEK